MNMAKGFIVIAEDTCKGCSLCTFYCPVNILKLDDSRTNKKGYTPLMVTEPEKCIACGFCATMCPDSVITVRLYLKEEN